MKTGNGKIANLPSQIRDELNWRINDGDEGKELVEWLNAKPEVIEVVTKLFDGKPISEQNLSQWRTHGYRKWHAEHVILDELGNLSQNSERIEETGIDCEKLLLVLKANYAEMIQCWLVTPTEQMTYRLDVFKQLTAAVLAMRREEMQKERLEIQRERLELLREKQNDKSESSSSSAPSSSPDSRSAERAEAPSPKPVPRAPASAKPPEPAPKPPETTPTPAANPAPPTAPTATTPPPKPKIPPCRDPRSRYSLR
jgi:hypothetical protein